MTDNFVILKLIYFLSKQQQYSEFVIGTRQLFISKF